MFDQADPRALGFSSSRLQRIADWSEGLVKSGRLAGNSILICRPGHGTWFHAAGHLTLGETAPVREDTIFRIYSMTKPVTSVALMMLYEQGLFHLNDPIAAYLPEFSETKVFASDGGSSWVEAMRQPLTIRHLLTHTSGLVHPLRGDTPVHTLYRSRGINFSHKQGNLAEMTRQLGALPLLFQPGERWHYGVSTDVIGRLVEVLSGQSLDRFFAKEIFAPLHMSDTGFCVPASKLGRLATLYTLRDSGQNRGTDQLTQVGPDAGDDFADPVSLFSGGGGLTSTISDYLHFAMMLRNGGEFNNSRLLGRKTVEFMRQNHLPGTMADMGEACFNSDIHLGAGLGFGLGFAVVLDPAMAQVMGSVGEYSWTGVGGTQFWIDPSEDLIVIQMAQMYPSNLVPTRKTLRTLVYQALDA